MLPHPSDDPEEVLCALTVAPHTVGAAHRRRRSGDAHTVGDGLGLLLQKVPYVMEQFRKVKEGKVPQYEELSVVGLVTVKPGKCMLSADAHLPSWSHEERILWAWCKQRSDAFTLEVVSRCKLNAAQKCSTVGSADNSLKNASLMPLQQVSREQVMSSARNLPEGMRRLNASQSIVMILTVPSVLALPILEGYWSAIMLTRGAVLRQQRLFLDWPPKLFWSLKDNPCTEVALDIPQDPAQIHKKLISVADLLRNNVLRCAEQKMDGNEPIEPAAIAPQDFKDAILFLEALASEHSEYKVLSSVPPRLVPLERLLDTVLLSRVLRRQDCLKETLQKALSLACPPWLNKLLQQRLETGEVQTMSKSAVHRARQMVDLAFALASRDTCLAIGCEESPSFIYFWADASPQWGREWLLGHLHIVTSPTYDALLKVVEAINLLAHTSPKTWQRWQEWECQGQEEADTLENLIPQRGLARPVNESGSVLLDDGGEEWSSDAQADGDARPAQAPEFWGTAHSHWGPWTHVLVGRARAMLLGRAMGGCSGIGNLVFCMLRPQCEIFVVLFNSCCRPGPV